MSIANGAPKLTPGGAVRMKSGWRNARLPYEHPYRPTPALLERAHETVFIKERVAHISAYVYPVEGIHGYGRNFAFYCKIGAVGENGTVPSYHAINVPGDYPYEGLMPGIGDPSGLDYRQVDHWADFSLSGGTNSSYQPVTTTSAAFKPTLTPTEAATLMRQIITSSAGNDAGWVNTIYDSVLAASGNTGWFFRPSYAVFSFLLPYVAGPFDPSEPNPAAQKQQFEAMTYEAPSVAQLEPLLAYRAWGRNQVGGTVRSGYLDRVELNGPYYRGGGLHTVPFIIDSAFTEQPDWP